MFQIKIKKILSKKATFFKILQMILKIKKVNKKQARFYLSNKLNSHLNKAKKRKFLMLKWKQKIRLQTIFNVLIKKNYRSLNFKKKILD